MAPKSTTFPADPVLDGDTAGSLESDFTFLIADAAGADYDLIPDHKIEVIDIIVHKRGAAGNGTDTVQIKNAASVISDAISLNVAQDAVGRAATITAANSVIDPAAGGKLRATVVRGADTVHATLDTATKTTHSNTVIQAVAPGTGGNAITVAYVADAGAKAGTITDVGGMVTVHFDDGVSTIADVEALLATATSVSVKTAGTGATVLHTGVDAFAATPLAGGFASNAACFVSVKALRRN